MVDPVSDKMPHELFGDGSPPATTRDRLLEHAQDLFYSRGFHAVGIDEIVRRAGVTKATFYNHFESRDDLIVEVIPPVRPAVCRPVPRGRAGAGRLGRPGGRSAGDVRRAGRVVQRAGVSRLCVRDGLYGVSEPA